MDAGSATCELDTAVGMAVQASESQARERGIALEVDGPMPRVLLAADSSFIAQTLQPLLDNAIRHARTRVVVRAANGAASVTLAIEDDGAGIAESDAAAIFEPGVQTAGGSGAGLGLALSRRLARSIDGEVRADPSAPGARLVVEWPTVSRGVGR
jgi:signal transduction histidine kinase